MTITYNPTEGTFPLVERRRHQQLPPPERCREIRRTAGVPLWEVAEDLGVTALTVSKWERGKTRPTREHAINWWALLRQLEDLIAERTTRTQAQPPAQDAA